MRVISSDWKVAKSKKALANLCRVLLNNFQLKIWDMIAVALPVYHRHMCININLRFTEGLWAKLAALSIGFRVFASALLSHDKALLVFTPPNCKLSRGLKRAQTIARASQFRKMHSKIRRERMQITSLTYPWTGTNKECEIVSSVKAAVWLSSAAMIYWIFRQTANHLTQHLIESLSELSCLNKNPLGNSLMPKHSIKSPKCARNILD